jgi:hypothetical protein
MVRVTLTELVLFLAPFALYVLFLAATRSGVLEPKSWPVSRLVWLGICAFALVIGSFVYFANYTGAPPGSAYVPAHIENGKLVPATTK